MNNRHTPLRTSRPRATRGLTLVELMVAVAILSVLLGAAVTSWKSVGASMRLSAFTNGFVSHFTHARSEAIKRNRRVVMCKSSDGSSCATTGGWEQGWIVFQDTNNNGRRDAEEAIVRRGDALPSGYRLTGNTTVASFLSFSPFGGTRLLNGGFQAGTLTVCKTSLEKADARQVVINAVGRPKIQRTTVAHCA
jgi:type IV fimbrial biogenesis protein FimT